MSNLLTKFIFHLKKPRVIIVVGKGKACGAEAVFQVLKTKFKIKRISEGIFPLGSLFRDKVLVIGSDLVSPRKMKKLGFFLKHSRLPVLIVTHIGDIPPKENFFAGELEAIKEIAELTESLPGIGYLVLNFDDETVRELKNKVSARVSTFGFQEGADFRASDINLNTGVNFKINYKGNIVPCWLEKLFGKEQIYTALAAANVGVIFGLNLVEISQALKSYQSLPGRMRLIEGIKGCQILDDSESASSFSMIEALEILKEIKAEGRKTAVLGDILGIGKYTIEVHESIGEKVAKAADLLFTVGPRAKFFAKGAIIRGMPEKNIFQFDDAKKAGIALQKEIRTGDLILVDGSKELRMSEVVEEIKKI